MSPVAGLLTSALEHQKSGDYQKARVLYRRILAQDPACDDAWHLSGLLEYQCGEHDAAITGIRRAIGLNPGIPLYHYNLGVVCRDAGDLGGSADALVIARQLKPSDPDAALSHAHVLQALGRRDEAVDAYHAVLNAVPDHTDAARALTSLLSSYVFTRYDAGYDALFNRLLALDAVDCQMLARPVASLLLRKYPETSIPGTVVELSSESCRRLAADPLLLIFLKKVINTLPEMEQLLTALRSLLIRQLYTNGQLPGGDIDFVASLAQQCLSNHHVFPVSAADRHCLDGLSRRLAALDTAAGRLSPDEELALMVYAMFEPISRLPLSKLLVTWPPANWSPVARSVMDVGLYEPAAEQAIKAGIETLSSSTNEVSVAVRALYEESPYPRWLAIRVHDLTDYRQRIGSRFPHVEPVIRSAEFRRILIAGCGTGRHPIEVARANPAASVTALDLSAASLAYGVKMARRLNVDNVRFLQGDLLGMKDTGMMFDVIECVGVLHHLEDPLEGWKTLCDRLVTGGLMRIGLYSGKARVSVTKCREYAVSHGLMPDKEGMDRLRTDILAGVVGDAVRDDMTRWNDFYSSSGVRDLLFHVMEHQYTLPGIRDCLDRLGLEFIGFDPLNDDIKQKYLVSFGAGDHFTNLDHWDEIEQRDPEIFRGMYQFWCRKLSDRPGRRIDIERHC